MTNYQVTFNPVAGILGIVSIIAMWKIFEDRGEQGWKALIPFYSTVTFGKVCGDEEDAKKSILWLVGFIVSSIVAVGVGQATESGILMLLFSLAALASSVMALVHIVKLYRNFDKVNNGPSWMIILWILLPAAAGIYYAFVQKNYNLPGISKKEDNQQDNNINS